MERHLLIYIIIDSGMGIFISCSICANFLVRKYVLKSFWVWFLFGLARRWSWPINKYLQI